jgi:haloalkane dehalogenase
MVVLLRTPEQHFSALAEYPFRPHYTDVVVAGASQLARMHYVDEGPSGAPVVLMLHGEPSWSYLYRRIIPRVAAAGLRAIAPDLLGFGRSDKPAARSDYSYQSHVDWLTAFILGLGLRDVTLFAQDWGGLLGLRIVGERPELFARVLASNTGLLTGDQAPNEAFLAWRRYSQDVAEFRAGAIISRICRTPLPPEAIAGYDAPFPDPSFQAGARQFPLLVPISPDDPAAPANRRAWANLKVFDRPFLTAFADGDPITRGMELALQNKIPGARGQPHQSLSGGHFIQEDAPEEIARLVVEFARRT